MTRVIRIDARNKELLVEHHKDVLIFAAKNNITDLCKLDEFPSHEILCNETAIYDNVSYGFRVKGYAVAIAGNGIITGDDLGDAKITLDEVAKLIEFVNYQGIQ